MSEAGTTTIQMLLDRLIQGDEAAAAQFFRAYEPFLRVIVRRQLSAALRAKFDSADVVQSVWADLLQRFREARYHFPDADHLRAFLVRATHNRFLDYLRRRLGELTHEQSLHECTEDETPCSPEPCPCQMAQAEELWERIRGLCNPLHLEVVELRRQGRPLAEIAAHTGLHEGSVRRILYTLARRLAVSGSRVEA
jgi:RNA polymerase sigma-70 factor (ECF subfamily)